MLSLHAHIARSPDGARKRLRRKPIEEWELFKKSLRERASKAKKTKAAKRA